jgi:hypothetical protein
MYGKLHRRFVHSLHQGQVHLCPHVSAPFSGETRVDFASSRAQRRSFDINALQQSYQQPANRPLRSPWPAPAAARLGKSERLD